MIDQARKDLAAAHEQWLSENPCALKDWRDRWKNDPDSALSEAWVRDYLHTMLPDRVRLGEIPGIGGPDFICLGMNGEPAFAVEVTNLDSKSLTTKTGLPSEIENWEGGGTPSISRILLRKRQNKVAQLERIELPLILAITTFHQTVARLYMGQDGIRTLYLPTTVRVVPLPPHDDLPDYERPCFQSSLFFEQIDGLNEYRRTCPYVSAVMLCAIPWTTAEDMPAVTLGLHPDPTRSFDPNLLPLCESYRLQSNWENIDPCIWQIERANSNP